MSVSVVITNLTASNVKLEELYLTLGPAGASNASVTVARSVAQLDSMSQLKSLLYAGTIRVVATTSSDNIDLLSIPVEQHGSAAVLVSSVAEVVVPVVYPSPFPTGVKPVIAVSMDKTGVTASRGSAYVQSITNLGFDVAVDVTTAVAAENPTFSPAESESTVGPFTATLAAAPLSDAPLTINWTEAIQATGTLTFTGQPADTETVTIDAKTYTFQTVLTNVDGNVLIGATAADSLANLYAAITLGAGAGTAYAAATTAHPTASASAPVGLTMLVWALVGGTGGNALASTTTVTGATWTAATLTGGVAAAARSATLSGTSTVGGANASRIAAASIVRTTGALSITFNARTIGTNNGPGTNSITVGYSMTVNWDAYY
jgi:hypothetical protein